MTEDEGLQEEKAHLIARLETGRRETLGYLRGVDDYAIIYAERGEWRLKDVLGHIASWEREILAALQAFHEGDPHPGGDDSLEEYSQRKVEERKGFDPAQLRMDWAMVRRDLQHAVADIDPARLGEPLFLPWGATGTVADLIEEVVRHEAAHLADILGVLHTQKE